MEGVFERFAERMCSLPPQETMQLAMPRREMKRDTRTRVQKPFRSALCSPVTYSTTTFPFGTVRKRLGSQSLDLQASIFAFKAHDDHKLIMTSIPETRPHGEHPPHPESRDCPRVWNRRRPWMVFRRTTRNDVVVATPRDKGSCHGMKR